MAEELENKGEEQEQMSAQIIDTTHASPHEDGGRKGAIARIAEILRGGAKPHVDKVTEVEEFVDDVDEPDETDTKSEEAEDTPESEDAEGEPEEDVRAEEYDEIDTRFVSAARSYGWSDDRIVQYAETHDDHDVVMLTGMMEGKARPVDKDDVTEQKEESPYAGVLKELETNEAVGGPTKQLLKSLVNDLQKAQAQLKSVTAGQEEVRQSKHRDEWLGRLRAADEVFDSAAKELPELGVTKMLKRLPDGTLSPNDPAVQVRENMFKMAVRLHNAGSSWDSAVRDALRWYRGGRDDAVEANVLKKIKDNSKRISPKRERRHQTRKFNSEIEEKAAVVNEALRKHGVELAE